MSDPVPESPPARPSLAVSTIVALAGALVVYLPAALGAELLQFDDNFFFGPDNPQFREGLWTVLTEPIANAWLPVAHASLWFDYQLGGGGAFLPHLHSLLLHALCGTVLARLLLRLGASSLVAHVAVLLFLLHPALGEAVAWASSRKVVLSALFVFVALDRVARAAKADRPARDVVVAAVCAALAMLANATAVVLPLLAVGVAVWTGGRRARWAAVAALFAVVAPIALVHRGIAAAEGTLAAGDAGARLLQAPGAFWHYLTTSLWPTRLNVLYPEVDTLEAFRAAWLPGAVAALVVVVAGVALCRTRRTRAVGAGLLAFVVALLPFNTVYPASSIAAADRYLYLAIPGLALAVAAAAAALHRRAPLLVGAVLAVPLVWLAGARAHEFRSDASLWQASLAVEPVNAVAHLNLVYAMAGQKVEAQEVHGHLEAAVEAARYPVHELRARIVLRDLALADADYAAASAHALAAVAAAERQVAREVAASRKAEAEGLLLQARLAAFEPLRLAGRDDEAEAQLAAAREVLPDHPQVVAFAAMRELAALRPELLARAAAGEAPRLDDDDPRGAAVDARLAAAREQHPEHAGLWLAQALWNQARDRVTAALLAYRKASELEEAKVRTRGELADPTAWLGAARMLRDRAMYESALEWAQGGYRMRPDPRLLQEAALALVGLNRLDDAQATLSAYVQLAPDDRDSAKILANLLIGRAYELLSDHTKRDDVRRLVRDALHHNPDETKAHLVLGRLAYEERRFAAAVSHLEDAFRLLPDLDDARLALTRSLAALGYDRLVQKDFDGAIDAWLRCVEVAPEGFDIARLRELLWDRLEARGVARLADGDLVGAIDDFRDCLRIDPEQHWAAWLLATALHRRPDADLAELEDLCRKAVEWQRAHRIDASKQVYLLAVTLQRRGELEQARETAREYLAAPADEAQPEVLAALRRLAEG